MTIDDAFVLDKDTIVTELEERFDNGYYSDYDAPRPEEA